MRSAHIIRVDGSEETHVVSSMQEVRELIGADTLDGFKLRDGRYVACDDTGMACGKPANPKATALYRGICKPDTTHYIAGDVAILVDSEWA